MSDPQEVYEAVLSQLKSTRSRKTLEALRVICEEHYSSGAVDFKVATISKLGANRGVPSAQTIRNKTGEPYRAVIEAWQELGNQRKKEIKNPVTPSGKYDWVNDVSKPEHRFLIKNLIGKSRELSAENKLLKSVKKLEIDYRTGRDVEPKNSPNPNLYDHELDALKASIDDDFLTRRGWKKGPRGSINDENNRVIFNNGWVAAIEKILSLS